MAKKWLKQKELHKSKQWKDSLSLTKSKKEKIKSIKDNLSSKWEEKEMKNLE